MKGLHCQVPYDTKFSSLCYYKYISIIFVSVCNHFMFRYSSVGVTSSYGLAAVSGFDSRQEQGILLFYSAFKTGSGANEASYSVENGNCFRGGKATLAAKLTTHLCLTPKLKML
jgi:hypothetical protein